MAAASGAPGVSYIVTIYNKAPYLQGVLAALHAQAGDFPRQYVLVDDGSTDGSAEIAAAILAGWQDAQLIRQDNRGPSAAVNRGLAEASLPFTYIVDSDDILAPYATRLLVGAALQSGCGAVYGCSTWYDSPADIHFPPEPTTIAVRVMEDALYETIRRGHAGGSTYVLDTALFKRVGGCDPRVFVQDQSVPQRMARVTRIGLIDCLVAMGPANEPNRLMKRPVQQQHDQSLTALLTLRDNPDLPHRFRRLVQKQTTGRAWQWARRHGHASMLSREFRLFLKARLPGVLLNDAMLETTLNAFRHGNAVRLMPSDGIDLHGRLSWNAPQPPDAPP